MGFNEVVRTKYGIVRGFPDECGTFGWKGVPYAKPPVGDLRWKAPRDPEPWDGVLDAADFCIHCPQRLYGDNEFSGHEDCLYLNIWRPGSDEKNLPVYFWVHGGGNSAAVPLPSKQPGARLAHFSSMVVVSINYRLGEFGWFCHPALRSGKAGSEYDDSGNYGTLDIIKGLEWVKDNIEAFGGNPGNVFLTGGSAGAFNIMTLLISPAAKNLFHKAMLLSGRWNTHTMAEGEAMAEEIIAQLLVNDGIASGRIAAESRRAEMTNAQIADYLRSKSISDFAACRPGNFFSPLLAGFQDGNVIPSNGFGVLDDGTHPNKIPIIIGMNKEEAKLFLFMINCRADEETYQLASSFASDLKKAVDCDALLRSLRNNKDQPEVYGYQFCWGARNAEGVSPIPDPYAHKLGAGHGLNAPFFWDVETCIDPFTELVFTRDNLPGRKALTISMMTYITRFVYTGDPNTPISENEAPNWEPWSNAEGGAKCILFDVDGDEPKIEMSTRELTEAEVWARFDSLENSMKRKIEKILRVLGVTKE